MALETLITLRPATTEDAAAIARVMRAALLSFEWLPTLHTPQEDLAFISNIVLPHQDVFVALGGGSIVGFIAVKDDWVEQFYLDPAWTGRGIGTSLLRLATDGQAEIRLHCFQQNAGARRFYERHGFEASAFGDGSNNEEGLPDILYVRRQPARASRAEGDI